MINFYNELHLGDCLYHIHYCRKLIDANPGLEIGFYIQSQFHNETQTFIGDYDIKLYDIKDRPTDAVNSWINSTGHFMTWGIATGFNYDLMYIEFYKYLSGQIKMDNPIRTSNDFLIDNPLLLETNNLSRKFDWLVINSLGNSGQWNGNAGFDKLIRTLKASGKDVITTAPNTEGVECTLDSKLNILEIGNLSTTCDYIIGVQTAPFVPITNIFNLNKVKMIYDCHNQGWKFSIGPTINLQNPNRIAELITILGN